MILFESMNKEFLDHNLSTTIVNNHIEKLLHRMNKRDIYNQYKNFNFTDYEIAELSSIAEWKDELVDYENKLGGLIGNKKR